MPDKKLTDKEIVKELERYSDVSDSDITTTCFKTRLLKEIYLFINRLQAENERLKKEKSKLENKIDEIYPLVMQLPNVMQQAKSEAYKEFAELLHCQCESIINQPHNENVRPISWKVAYEEFDEKVDNLLKELVGDTNESKA